MMITTENKNKKKYILTIAGHDPSGGAGLTSDIKTFEAHGLYGLSVCTAITVQNDVNFKDCTWVVPEDIIAQMEILFARFKISVVKIGIVESWEVLLKLLNQLKRLNPEIKIVLDPIFKASSGFDFHSSESQELLNQIWKNCFIITPNYDEIQWLYPEKNIEDTLEYISNKTTVYLKGGHRTDKKGYDALYYSRIVKINLLPNVSTVSEKHGSGCVLSAALAANLALEVPLEDAAKLAKNYTEQFLNSNKTLLGYHNYN